MCSQVTIHKAHYPVINSDSQTHSSLIDQYLPCNKCSFQWKEKNKIKSTLISENSSLAEFFLFRPIHCLYKQHQYDLQAKNMNLNALQNGNLLLQKQIFNQKSKKHSIWHGVINREGNLCSLVVSSMTILLFCIFSSHRAFSHLKL